MMSLGLIASARSVDTTNSHLSLVLGSVGVLAATAVLAFVAVRVGLNRRRPREVLVGFAILWALAADATALVTMMQRTKWQEEADLRLQSGYYDPGTAEAGKPGLPVKTAAGLGAGYLALIVYAGTGKGRGAASA